MQILIEQRVEQALMHLRPVDEKKIKRVISDLGKSSFVELMNRFHIRKLDFPGEKIFLLRATDNLRMLLKYDDQETLVIEDIVSRGMLEHFRTQLNS